MKKMFSWLGCLVAVLFLATNTTFANAKTDLSNKSATELLNGTNTVMAVPDAPPLIATCNSVTTGLGDDIGTLAVTDVMLSGFHNATCFDATNNCISAADPVPLNSAVSLSSNISGKENNDQGYTLNGANNTAVYTATVAPKDDGQAKAKIANSWGTTWGYDAGTTICLVATTSVDFDIKI